MSAAIPLLRHAMAPLREALSWPGVEDVAVNRPGEAWVRRGTWDRLDLPGLDLPTLEGVAILGGALRRQDVGRHAPLLGTELPEGERLQVVMAPCVPAGTISLTIRKPGGAVAPLPSLGTRYDTAGWNAWAGRAEAVAQRRSELLDRFDAGDAAAFLEAAVRHRLNVLLCGATGSGKTSVGKMLMGAIGADERIVTIEDALELVVPQPNHVRLLYSQGGAGPGVADLLVASLRMRPDRVMLQELREPAAAMTYVMEIMAGHPGSITTIHGDDPVQAARRLFALVKGAPGGAAMDDATLLTMIGGAVDLIVPLHNHGSTYSIREMWFRDDVARRGEALADLLRVTA